MLITVIVLIATSHNPELLFGQRIVKHSLYQLMRWHILRRYLRHINRAKVLERVQGTSRFELSLLSHCIHQIARISPIFYRSRLLLYSELVWLL